LRIDHNNVMTIISPVYLTKTGQPRLGPEHKKPHFDKRPFRSTLFWAYREEKPDIETLKSLRTSIQERSFKPFFDRNEIDVLLEQEVTTPHGAGVYQDQQSLKTFKFWQHFLNNIASAMAFVSDYNSSISKDSKEEDKAYIQTTLRLLKIIEDWFYYHPDILGTVIANVPTPEEEARLNALLAVLGRR